MGTPQSRAEQVWNGGGKREHLPLHQEAAAGLLSLYSQCLWWRRSLPTRLPPQSNEAVGARQWLARLYYGFNRRTWTSRYRQIYNSIQSVRHTQGRCKQGRGPESGCAKWARRGVGGGRAGRVPSSPGSTLARQAVRRGLFAGPRGQPPRPGAERRVWACGEAG